MARSARVPCINTDATGSSKIHFPKDAAEQTAAAPKSWVGQVYIRTPRGIVHASPPGTAVKIITRRHQVSANARGAADLIKVLFAPRELLPQRWYLQSRRKSVIWKFIEACGRAGGRGVMKHLRVHTPCRAGNKGLMSLHVRQDHPAHTHTWCGCHQDAGTLRIRWKRLRAPTFPCSDTTPCVCHVEQLHPSIHQARNTLSPS